MSRLILPAAPRICWALAFGVVIALTGGSAWAADQLLTEDRALGLFYRRNLELISASFGLETARAERIVAAAIPNPELILYSQEIAPRYPEPAIGPALYANVTQLIETAGKRRLRMESSELGSQAAESDLLDTARTLSQAVRKAFYGLLLAQKTVDTAQEQVVHVEKLADANQQRFDVGDISERDLTRIKVEALKVRSDVDRAVAELASARAELALLLAWPPNAEQLVAEDRWPGTEMLAHVKDPGVASMEAIEHRPDIQAAKLRQDQAKKDIELAKAQAIPNVTVLAGFGHDWGNIVTNAAQVGISVPLPLFYRNEGQIAQAGVRANDREVQVRRTENTVRSEVHTALAAWRSTDAVVKRYENEILQKAKSIRDSAEFAYSHGSTDIIDLVQAQRDYRNALFDYYQAQANRAFAYADMKMALGEERADLYTTPDNPP